MPVKSVTLSTRQLERVLESAMGGITRDTLARGKRVEGRAKRLAPVDSARLRASITTEILIRDGMPVARVGTNVKYAAFIHDGTGIYGPKGRPIRPKNPGGRLVFKPKGSSTVVFAKEVRGVRPTKFMYRALDAAR